MTALGLGTFLVLLFLSLKAQSQGSGKNSVNNLWQEEGKAYKIGIPFAA